MSVPRTWECIGQWEFIICLDYPCKTCLFGVFYSVRLDYSCSIFIISSCLCAITGNLSLSWTSSLPQLQVFWDPSLAQLSRCTEEVFPILYTFPMISHLLLISHKQGALAGESNRDHKLISWNHEITALRLSWTGSGSC